MEKKRIRVAVLASGRGTDLQSLIDASEAGNIDADVVLVISDKPDSFALERAKKHRIPGICIPHKDKTRKEHEREIMEYLEKYNVDLIVLAGYLRVLTPYFIQRYYGKIINIHPALLPLFGGMGMYGDKVHKAVLESGMKVSGCSVHFVDETPDGGPIIVQTPVLVREDDTPETLASRVLEEEHKLLPCAVQLFAEDRLRIIERKRVKILEY